MTADEFLAGLQKIKLSRRQAGLSGLFGVGERQIFKWLAGEQEIHGAAANLLRLMIRHKLTADDVLKPGRK